MSTGTIQERHIALVLDVDDPEVRGRVTVRCDTLLGDGQQLPFWVEPDPVALGGQSDGSVDAGVWFFPTPGMQVELVVTIGHERDQTPGQASMDAPSVRWRPARLTDLDSIPETMKTNYPDRRGWTTPAGHYWLFDDSPGGRLYLAGQMDDAGDLARALAMGALDAGELAAAGLTPGLIGFLLWEKAGGSMLLLESGGDALLTAAVNLHLNDPTKTAQGVARINDAVSAAVGMAVWMGQVAAACNTLLPGSVAPVTPADFGTISAGSATVKAGG